jgi:NADPH-dependent 2,4-dienoyl-CoA reductase/sulfur reductase-like enzyme
MKMSPGLLEARSENTRSHDGNIETTEGVIGPNCIDQITRLRSMPEAPAQCQVCVVGAGPAGLMLGANLARFGIKAQVIDDRADPTPVGR